MQKLLLFIEYLSTVSCTLYAYISIFYTLDVLGFCQIASGFLQHSFIQWHISQFINLLGLFKLYFLLWFQY